jgi:hypothetical protein
MTKTQVIEYFGGVTETARALDLSQPSVSEWAEDKIPIIRQLQIEAFTGGKLRAGPECDAYRVGKQRPSALV